MLPEPITAASVELGVIGFMKAALGLRFLPPLFFAFFFAILCSPLNVLTSDFDLTSRIDRIAIPHFTAACGSGREDAEYFDACQRFSEGKRALFPLALENRPRMPAVNIAELRQEYMRAGLAEAQVDANPIKQFERWFEDALKAGVPLPNAMTLASVSASGAPSARIVLLKGIEAGGFVFYTNYRSRKARELDARAAACLVFLWSGLERQVRI